MSDAATITEIPYVGDELELFSHALNWKSYLRRQISPFLGKRVLEVGAGIGATTRMLCDGTQENWRCLEPDLPMARLLETQILNGELPACCQAQAGTVADVDEQFDSLIYIDVLEHIPADREEIALAAEKVRPGGFIVVLSPAHNHLYTAFDKRIGHCRRYSKEMLAELTTPMLSIERLRYLDCVGYFASLANRLMLRQSMPTLNQIRLWDGLMVPLSKLFDPLLRYKAGKSVLCIWRKEAEPVPPVEPPTPGRRLARMFGLVSLTTLFAIAALLVLAAREGGVPNGPGFRRRVRPAFQITPPAAIAFGAVAGAVTFHLLTRQRGRRP
ncbi:MAG TPA: methyltransferase domain-containing protein [Caulifigura sp.]|jgi:SAM-dependent methyltransferase|nr:methyltransferase domain-containing protein [Caulifigura sp.]